LEGRIQQVWALQQLQEGDWRTRSGHGLKVRFPGRWNRGAGPDFREAVIELDGEVRVGDIEIHLYREDWWRHGHDHDPAYNGVLLHVVLFAGGMERPIETAKGRLPEEWVMGPWMREDLESVSGGEPGLFGELVPELREWMESDQPQAIRERLKAGADRRWQDKEAMARCLHDGAGWRGGLHRMVLYYLGFPFNRRPFFEMAEAYPLELWREEGLLEDLCARWEQSVRWGLGRPANRARRRLTGYLHLNHEVPDWPERLRQPPSGLLGCLRETLLGVRDGLETRTVRRLARISDWREWLIHPVLGGVLGGSLVDRLWIDVFLPFLVVDGQIGRESAAALWLHWVPAACPDAYGELFKLAGIQLDPQLPLCNAWVQGLLWLEDQLRTERIRTSTGTAATCRSGSGA
ncbi:MAG TPA: DUF2851 family protein, partial [Oceanipulchritudo sp.]|nr:DUF2851 family protein [Oceanipulchritudo sp.]